MKITMYFSNFHDHYNYEDYEDYKELKRDIHNIINGEYGIISFYINNKWHCTCVLYEKLPVDIHPKKVINMMGFRKDTLRELNTSEVLIIIDYWNEADSLKLEKKKED